MTADAPSLLVVVNPNASRAKEALPLLAQRSGERRGVSLHVTEEKGDLARLLAAHGPHADRIVIGGGDGTVSEALPLLLKLDKPVAVLPLGTANDFARTLGLPTDPSAALETALSGRLHKIDVGFANDCPFLNVASVGLAAEAIKQQSKGMKRTWKMLAYPISLVRAAMRLKPFFVDLDIDGRLRWSAAVYQVSVGNGRYHGGGLSVAEDAAIDDGKLHLYAVLPGTFWQLFACLTHLRFGLMKPKVLDRHSARTVRLGTQRPREINADGKVVTTTPVEFRVMSKALTVIVPQHPPKTAALNGVPPVSRAR
jgi:YegS/Rv2252/BmrU family lipid kinase